MAKQGQATAAPNAPHLRVMFSKPLKVHKDNTCPCAFGRLVYMQSQYPELYAAVVQEAKVKHCINMCNPPAPRQKTCTKTVQRFKNIDALEQHSNSVGQKCMLP